MATAAPLVVNPDRYLAGLQLRQVQIQERKGKTRRAPLDPGYAKSHIPNDVGLDVDLYGRILSQRMWTRFLVALVSL